MNITVRSFSLNKLLKLIIFFLFGGLLLLYYFFQSLFPFFFLILLLLFYDWLHGFTLCNGFLYNIIMFLFLKISFHPDFSFPLLLFFLKHFQLCFMLSFSFCSLFLFSCFLCLSLFILRLLSYFKSFLHCILMNLLFFVLLSIN